MATLMETNARPIPTPSGPIDRHLQETEPESVDEAVGAHRAARQRYAGGLQAERQSYNRLRARTRSAIRAAYLSRVGRRIDLIALLRQRDQERRPVWTVADPLRKIDRYNGRIENDGDVCVGKAGSDGFVRLSSRRRIDGDSSFEPAGMPALPPRVRELASDPKIRGRARWIGVLYQPEEWHEIDPDPALVVEWKDRPDEYFALAIWGDDRPEIEEFLD